MKLMGMPERKAHVDWTGFAAWTIFFVIFLNVLIFTIHCVNPVLMSDDWYFLDVFVRKGIVGNLHFADFFVKRMGIDHSEPFIKMVLLWCLREFDLDISVEALVGVFVALGCVLLFRAMIMNGVKNEAGWTRHMAWISIAAIIFSLNGIEIWAWPLNSAQYSSFLPLPVFMWTVWRSYCRREYLLLAVVTLLMAFISDDNAVIGILATLMTLAFYALSRGVAEKGVLLRIVVVVLVCASVVRIGYSYAPQVYGAPDAPLADKLHALFNQVRKGEWPGWFVTPLTWAVASRLFTPGGQGHLVEIVEFGILVAVIFIHGWFWFRAVRYEWNLLVFVSIALMLVTYGWIAGILLYRVPALGADYFRQDRYIRLYQFELVAFVLMWIGSVSSSSPGPAKERLVRWGKTACLGFLVLQIPMSVSAWMIVPGRQHYDQDLARQIYRLAANPSDSQVLSHCNPQLPICGWGLEKRQDLLRLLQENHLNIFSPKVVLAHPYLLNATSSMGPADRAQLLSALQATDAGKSAGKARGSMWSFFGVGRDMWPRSGIGVNDVRRSHVPLMLTGCWAPNGRGHQSESWCGPEVSLVLRKPAETSGLVIEGLLPWDLYAKDGRTSPVTLLVTVNDVPVAKKTIGAEEGFAINVPEQELPALTFPSEPMYVRISADGSFVRSRVLRVQDPRELSMKLSNVSFLTSAEDAQ
ncbi:hypothetical protein [Dyella sp. 2HG41-7]|uniref:hypothetical protein n=1 Tax=Dyella sp. 2HG41-7 TaxID=2883239 RepID=UPI001F2D687D|nr:hypothetical protein [Dyella sp. 2HG41-7]